jgi:hypothetical protein
MNFERAILIAFIGNYLINNLVAGLVTLIPGTPAASYTDPHYIGYIIIAAIFVAVYTYWYGAKAKLTATNGALFGVIGFAVAIVTAFISGIAGVVAQSGSISQAVTILPQFGAYIANWSTLALLAFWVIPAAIVGYVIASKVSKAPASPSFGAHAAPAPHTI